MKKQWLQLSLLLGIILGTSLAGTMDSYAKNNQQNNEKVEVSKEQTDYASFSSWNLDEDSLSLYFTGENALSSNYSSTYYLETEYGTFTLQSDLQKQGHKMVTTLKDESGKVIFTNKTALTNNRNFDLSIPTELLAHSSKTGLQVKIYDEQHEKETIISTANTVPDYLILGIGVLLAGGAIFLARKRKVEKQ